jgi:hypothetical protein
MRKIPTAVLASGAILAVAVPANAHHSGAMFDEKKEIVVTGVVKKWDYVNPHAWLHVTTTGHDGKPVLWSFEGGRAGAGGDSPNSTLGKRTFKPGDRVTIKTHPMKDGRPAGTLGEVTFADGRKLSPR